MSSFRNAVKELVRNALGSFDVPILSGINRGRRWRIKSGVTSCWFGTYEHHESSLLAALIPAGGTVFDVGSHVGYYTLAASRIVGPKGQVVAFEPDPQNLFYLRHHLASNRTANVTVIDRPVGDKHDQVVSFVANTEFSYESGVRDAGEAGGADMRLVSLDQVRAEQGVSPDVVKMDIEGFEGAALAGARSVMAERKAAWLISLHGLDQAFDCIGLLRDAGYDVYDVKNGKLLTAVIEFPIYSILGLPKGRSFPKLA